MLFNIHIIFLIFQLINDSQPNWCAPGIMATTINGRRPQKQQPHKQQHHSRLHQNHRHHCRRSSTTDYHHPSQPRTTNTVLLTAIKHLLKINCSSRNSRSKCNSSLKETAISENVYIFNNINNNSQLHSVNNNLMNSKEHDDDNSAFKRINCNWWTDWFLSFNSDVTTHRRPFAMIIVILLILSGLIPATIARPNISITSTQQLLQGASSPSPTPLDEVSRKMDATVEVMAGQASDDGGPVSRVLLFFYRHY